MLAGSDWPALVDYALDHDFTAADMAVMFAGTAPGHLDGLPQVWLAQWLDLLGKGDDVLSVQCIEIGGFEQKSGAVAVWGFNALAALFKDRFERQHGGTYIEDEPGQLRAAAMRAWSDEEPFPTGAWSEARDVMWECIAIVRRDMKRCVLSLPWADGVRIMQRAVLQEAPDWSWDDGTAERDPRGARVRKKLRERGFRLDLNVDGAMVRPITAHWDRDENGWAYTQTIHAVDLITPEPI